MSAPRWPRSSRRLLDVLSCSAQHSALEMVADQSSACIEQLVEQLEEVALSGVGLAALGLDSFAHVMVEQLHRLARGPVHSCRIILGKVHELAERDARRNQLHARRDGLEVLGRIDRLVFGLDWDQESSLL